MTERNWPGRLLGVSCAIATCLLAAPAHAAVSWSRPTEIIGNQEALSVQNALSCASTSFCVFVASSDQGMNGAVITYNGHRWSRASRVDPAGNGLSSVSCPSVSFCVAVDGGVNALTYDGHSWSAPVNIDTAGINPGLVSVSCTSSSFCMAVDDQGNAIAYDGHAWSTPTAVGPPSTHFWQVSCGSPSLCVATEYESGRVFMYRSGRWTSATIGASVYGVSCASSSFCVAIDNANQSRVITYHGGGWGKPRPIDPRYGGLQGLNAISCTSASFCVATASADAPAFVYNGSSWKRERPNVIAPITSISCRSASFCAAVDDQGFAYTYTRGSRRAHSR